MRKEAEQELSSLCQNSNHVFCFIRRLKKDLEGGWYLSGKDGQLGFIKEDRAKIWKKHMEKIMNEEKNGTTWWKLM